MADEERRPAINTVCHDCGGRKVVFQEVLYVERGEGASLTAPKTCETCKGQGRLPGLQPPA